MHRIRSTVTKVGVLLLAILALGAPQAWASGAENGGEKWGNPVVPPKGFTQAFVRDYKLMAKTVVLQERKRPKDWEKIERISQKRGALQQSMNERLRSAGYPEFYGEYFCEKGLRTPHEELPRLECPPGEGVG